MIWHIRSQWDKIPAFKLFQSCHFSHIPRGQEMFRDIIYLKISSEKTAQRNCAQKYGGRWRDQSLDKMYKSVKTLFDFDARDGINIKRKRF